MQRIIRWPFATIALRLPQAIVAGEKSRDLPVGTPRIAVRHRNRVALDKLGTVVFVVEPFEQLPEFCIHNTTVFMQ